jgi:hypothetical protein
MLSVFAAQSDNAIVTLVDLDRCTAAKLITLEGNGIDAVGLGACHWSSLTHLSELRLARNKITSAAELACLAHAPALKVSVHSLPHDFRRRAAARCMRSPHSHSCSSFCWLVCCGCRA